MAEGPDNLILQYLRRSDRRLETIETDMKEVKGRMSSIDESVAPVNRRLDRLDERVERIEKRLDLAEVEKG